MKMCKRIKRVKKFLDKLLNFLKKKTAIVIDFWDEDMIGKGYYDYIFFLIF